MEATQKKKRRTRAEVMLTKPVSSDLNVRATVDGYTRGTIEQLGGMDRLGAGQRAMLLVQRITLATIMRLQSEIDVAADAQVPTDGLMRTLSRYLMVFRQNQVALGLARARAPRVKAGAAMDDITEEYRRRHEAALLVEEHSPRKTGA